MPLAAQAHVSSAKKGYFPCQPLPNVETGFLARGSTLVFSHKIVFMIGSIFSGLGSIASGIASLKSAEYAKRENELNRKWQEKMNLLQFQQQKDLTKYTNDIERETTAEYWKQYNSPAAQRAAYRAAGINPFVEGSSLQSVPASTSPSAAGSPGTPTPSNPYTQNPWSAIADSMSGFTQAALSAEKISAEVQNIKANTAKVESETIAQQNENSLFGMVRQSAELDVLSKKYRSALDAINVEWASIEKMQDAAQKDAATQELLSRVKSNLANAAKTDADRENQKILTSALESMYKSSASLSQEQAKTEGVKRENIAAQTETENELRNLRKALTQNQINEITQKIRSSRVLSAEGIERLYAWLRGDRDANSLFGIIDKYVTGAGKDLLSSQYNNDIRSYLYDLLNGSSK